MFVNTLVLRGFPSGEKSFTGYLREVRENTLKSFDNQDYQFEDLVENIAVERDASRNPLFDAMLILMNMLQPEKITEEEMGNLQVKPFVYERMTARFDLTLSAVEVEDILSFRIGYCTRLFKKETVERFIRFFKNIMWSVLQTPAAKISGIEIIPEEEKTQVLFEFNDTAAKYPRDKVIHGIFAEQAVRTPGMIALVGSRQYAAEGKEEVQLSFRELDKRSGRLAALLRRKGIETGSIAAILIEPIIEMIIGIMGVLKTGGCYLPLSPQTPQGRIAYILEDSEARLVLTQLHPEDPVTFAVENVDIDSESIYKTGDHLPGTAGSPDDPVYMIYTSGTTGKPKGVLLKHGNLVNYVNWFSGKARLTPEDKTLLTASFTFDLGYTTVYPSLLTGAQLHILPREVYLLPERLLSYVRLKRISYLKMAPSQFAPVVACSFFTGETCRSLRLIVLGGEAINAADVEKAYGICRHLEIMNHYGPTEVTIGCIAQFIDIDGLEAYKNRPTIGKPIFNTNVFILDRYFNLVPVGIAGELCLSGAGVAKGYLKRESLTAERFITNKLRQREGIGTQSFHDRIYRTGDLARWLPDGNIQFLGRMDNQVKIRGFRIELGEIENQLSRHEDIKEAAVLVKKTAREKSLAAYIVSDRKFDVSQLREYLAGQLPDYMIPSHFAQVEKIPLTANGKLDQRALERCGTALGTGVQFEAPRNEIEEKIANTWREVLKLDRVGIHENFFDLGGTSLDLIKISTKLNEFLQEGEAVVQMFRYTTISSYARYLSQKTGGAELSDQKINKPLQVDKIKKSRASQKNKRRGIVNVRSN
jgi:amino acid adenylation domain-containing protein